MMFTSEAEDINQACSMKKLVMEMDEVRRGNVRWQEYCCVQFLCVHDDDAIDIVKKHPDIMMGGVGRPTSSLPPLPPPTRQDQSPHDAPPGPPGPPPPPTAPKRFRIDTPSSDRSRTPPSQNSREEPQRIAPIAPRSALDTIRRSLWPPMPAASPPSPATTRSRSGGYRTPDSGNSAQSTLPWRTPSQGSSRSRARSEPSTSQRSSPASTLPYSAGTGATRLSTDV